MKQKHAEAKKKILEDEKRAENERVNAISGQTNPDEKKRLETEHMQKKAEAADRIRKLQDD